MNDQLRADPRTAWAMYAYQQASDLVVNPAPATPLDLLDPLGPLEPAEPMDSLPPIPDQIAKQILTWLQHEHAEVITIGCNGREPTPWEDVLQRPGFVVRTLTRTVLITHHGTTYEWPSTYHDLTAPADHLDQWTQRPDTLAYAVSGAKIIQVFAPTSDMKHCMHYGAGSEILRLPEHPDVPPPPDLAAITSGDTSRPFTPRIPTGWEAVEQIATDHLRHIGVHDAHRTTAGADGGIDVDSTSIAAQVKHTAQPVDRPTLQALVGASRPAQQPACYSTAGYTPQAISYADTRNVALHQITETGDVVTVGTVADELHRSLSPEADQWTAAQVYADEVTTRGRAVCTQLVGDSIKSYEDLNRADNYRHRFNTITRGGIDSYATPREAILAMHHAELCLATWAVHDHGSYPSQTPAPPEPPASKPLGIGDFY